MVVFIDLEEEDIELPQDGQPPRWHGSGNSIDDVVKAAAKAAVVGASASSTTNLTEPKEDGTHRIPEEEEAQRPPVRENPNRNSMTKALGCYPIIMSVAQHIDLNTLDNLSRTCRQIRQDLLQYRKMLLVSTLHCTNEHLPVDPEETLRYRARAMNWFYMEDAGRTSYTGKSGQCARDMVAGCRRCGTVVCRNCAIKPPAPIVLRDRHRRLCMQCQKAPLGSLLKPPLDPSVPLSSDIMRRSVCTCDSSTGVWLCQPCGRTIRSDDSDYKSIWKWRREYTDVLGGLGTGIGEGDRGVICGRETSCCAAREREQETDCEAEDAAADANINNHLDAAIAALPTLSYNEIENITTESTIRAASWARNRHTNNNSPNVARQGISRVPSPTIKAGYERHEMEGIGGVMKKKRLRMVKVGQCVPEWADERAAGDILGREVNGKARSWCGWCWRVIPNTNEYREMYKGDMDGRYKVNGKGKEVEDFLPDNNL